MSEAIFTGRTRGRLLTQFGMYSQATPRNDASTGRGEWNLDNAYRYISEAYGGYHIDKWNGINVDAGIFMSYVGLFSYYQYDNWSYQPSYVSSNTPWFFNGVRIQVFPSDRFKAELWIVNGWQSYGRFNHAPGLGFQLLWRPTSSLSILSNNYFGTDTPGTAARKRIHTDDSVQYKYLENPGRLLDSGPGGITPLGGNSGPPGSAVPGFLPDLRRTESRFTGALLVKL
ncbi:MAG: outer membrane beta-barrel protein [Acidobacteriota bacterium]